MPKARIHESFSLVEKLMLKKGFKSISSMAAYLGLTPPAVYQWKHNGVSRRRKEQIEKLLSQKKRGRKKKSKFVILKKSKKRVVFTVQDDSYTPADFFGGKPCKLFHS